MNFKELLAEKTRKIDEMIAGYLPGEGGEAAELARAIRYSMEAPGKRLRPIMLLESCRMFGGKEEEAKPFAAALEMIHTHSLIHDDLPAIDGDDLRRGVLTTWAAFGEALGILSGDALLNLAYETALTSLFETAEVHRAARALEILAEKTGIRGMLGGQSVDVQSQGQSVREERLLYIYRKKTAALMEAPLMMGAVLAGAGEDAVFGMEEVGSYVGLAFQIRDDILDVTQSSQVLGKPAGSDEKNQKATYVKLHGLEAAEKEVLCLSEKALARFDGLGAENPFLRQLILQLIRRQK